MDFSGSLNDAPSLVGYVGCGMDYYNAGTPTSLRVPGIPMVGGDLIDPTNRSDIFSLTANGIPSAVYSNPQWRVISSLDMVDVLDGIPRIQTQLTAASPTSQIVLSIQSTNGDEMLGIEQRASRAGVMLYLLPFRLKNGKRRSGCLGSVARDLNGS